MNAEIKRRWVDALRSTDYRQGEQYLHREQQDGPRYCCLGVLCDLAVQAGIIPKPIKSDDLFGYGDFDGSHIFTILPNKVVIWAELRSPNPQVTTVARSLRPLADLNDGGATFLEIADIIEEQL